jgi:sigma-70-like protein
MRLPSYGAGYRSPFVATFDQLSADQRAIIELVLQRGRSYDQLADLLTMPEPRVRELARDALVRLAPITAQRVEDDWRGQLADYVLGQQSGPESTATKGHLRRSEPARAWARSLLDSLENLYENGLPSIPEGERGARERRPRRRDRVKRGRERVKEPAPPDAARPEPAAPELSADAQAAIRRRRLVALGGGLGAVLLVAVLLWPVGLLTGSDDNGGGSSASSRTGQPASTGAPAGIAVFAERDGGRQVIVQAASLLPSKQREAYEVWLYNSPKDAKSLGAQVTDSKGTYQGAGPLPSDYARFKFIDVSREPIDQNRSHSGQSVLRGQLGKLRPASQGVKRGQATILGQVVLTPPKGG